jgi:hypothetical protein
MASRQYCNFIEDHFSTSPGTLRHCAVVNLFRNIYILGIAAMLESKIVLIGAKRIQIAEWARGVAEWATLGMSLKASNMGLIFFLIEMEI